MSLEETINKLLSKPYYKCHLLKNRQIIKTLIEEVTDRSFIYDSKTKTAYIVPQEKGIIHHKLAKIFYCDIDNAVPYSSGEIEVLPEDLVGFADYEEHKQKDKSKFRKYILNPLSNPSILDFVGKANIFWLTYLPTVLVGKWLSGETISMVMESPKEKNKLEGMLPILLIAGIALAAIYLLFGRN